MIKDYEVYGERIVAFIDILGFKNHILKTVDNLAYRQHLLRVMNKVVEIKAENDKGLLAQKSLGKEVTIFSDCIVLSYPLDFEGGLFHILIDLVHICLEMFSDKILFRGGITIGNIYHNDNIVFGPAMVEAYELEAKYAKHPRIILSKETIYKAIMAFNSSQHSLEVEWEYIGNLIKRDDNDEFYFLDILSQYQEIECGETFINMLFILKDVIVEGINAYIKFPSILDKYLWLKDYFNQTVQKYEIENLIIQ